MIHNTQKWISEQSEERTLLYIFRVGSHYGIRAEPSSGLLLDPEGAMLSELPSVGCPLRDVQFPSSVFLSPLTHR